MPQATSDPASPAASPSPHAAAPSITSSCLSGLKFGARLALWIVAIGALLGAGVAALNGRWTEYGQLVAALAFCGAALAVATAGVWGIMHVLASRQS